MKKALQLFSLFSLAFVFLAAVARADEPDYGSPAGTVIVPDGLKSEEVQRCILEAGAGRGWTIRKKDDEKVVLFLEQGRWVSNLTLTYTTKEIQIFSKSTRSGKPKLPEDWIKFLKKDISVKLNTLSISK